MVLWVEGLAGNQKFWILLSAQIVAFYMLMRPDSPFPETEANIPTQPVKSWVHMETWGLNISQEQNCCPIHGKIRILEAVSEEWKKLIED